MIDHGISCQLVDRLVLTIIQCKGRYDLKHMHICFMLTTLPESWKVCPTSSDSSVDTVTKRNELLKYQNIESYAYKQNIYNFF